MAAPNVNNKNQVNNTALTDFKAGTKRSQMKSDVQKSIFDSIDTNHDGIISKGEMKGIVDGKVKNKNGKLVEKQYIKLKDLGNGRSLVVDSNGKQWVRAHDGTILKESYVKNNFKTQKQVQKATPARKTVANIAKMYNNNLKVFNKQLADDGWAGDIADGFSKLWNNDLFGGGTGNTASQVREKYQNEKKRIVAITNAAKKGDAALKAEFKKQYGREYSQKALDEYFKNPTEANYKKAFGSKFESLNSINNRYIKSQQTGAEVVKTTTKVTAGVAIGAAVVATGGGALALGATALGTAAASAAVDETDRMHVTGSYKDASGKTVKTKGVFRESTDHKKIFKSAAWDGVSAFAGGAVGNVANKLIGGASKMAITGQIAANTAGDVTIGAAREYAETGEITASGVAANALMSGVGGAVSSGTLSKGVDYLKKGFSKVEDKVSSKINIPKSETSNAKILADTNAGGVKHLQDIHGNTISGGLFSSFKNKATTLSTKDGWRNFDTSDGAITICNTGDKIYMGKVGDASSVRPIKVSQNADTVLGTSPSGKTITATKDANGNIVIRHLESQNPNSLPHNTGTVSKTVSTKLSDVPKNIRNRKKFQAGMADVDSIATSRPEVSQKLVRAIEMEKNGQTLVKTLDPNINPKNIAQHVDDGNVCAIGSRLYVNDNGTAVPLKMSKEKFEELFPPVGCALTDQNAVNSCWLVSQINAMTESSGGRVNLYTMLEQDGNDILVHLKNRETPIRFSGGKPVNYENIQLGEGAAPGLDMIYQSVLSERLSVGGIVDGLNKTKISDFSVDEMAKYANETGRPTAYAMRALHSPKEIIQDFYEKHHHIRGPQNVQNALEDFKPGKDIIAGCWEGHERHIVNYNAGSKTVTFHDPYYGGVDRSCPLDDFLKKDPNLRFIKRAELTPNKPNTAAPPAPAANTNPSVKAEVPPLSPKVEHNPVKPVQTPRTETPAAPKSSFESRITDLSNRPLVVARTADGTPIGASVTQSNVVLIKNGKRTAIPIPERGNSTPVRESSTDTFLIIHTDKNGKVSITTSETPDLPNVKTQTPPLTPKTAAKPAAEKRVTNQNTQSLSIPAGYREHGKILGKRAIINANQEVMYESGGTWKKLN